METKPKAAYPARRHPRYIVADVRIKSDTHLTGKVREPWQVIDTLRNKIFDEFHDDLGTAASLLRIKFPTAAKEELP
jgi:hypothetical protein